MVGVRVEQEVTPHTVGDKNQRTDLMVHMQVFGTSIRERYITQEPPAARVAVNLQDTPLRTAPGDGPDRANQGVQIID